MLIKLIKKLRMSFILFSHRGFLKAKKGFTCGRGTVFYAKKEIRIGNNVYIGKYCTIECDAQIGNEVLIANNVGLVGRFDHNYRTIGTPVRFAPNIRNERYTVSKSKQIIIIGDDVWVGFGAIILSGVTIGNGAIVAAGSVVVEDVEPFSVVTGVPAKKKAMRFNEHKINQHKIQCKKNGFTSYL